MCYASQGGSQVFKGEGHSEPIRGYSPVFVTRNHSHKGGGGEEALQDSPSYALASNFSISNKILENFQ